MDGLHVVTGAFGYTGRYITERLLRNGAQVLSLTGHPERSGQFGGRVAVAPFNFDKPAELAKSLAGATTLYNTYWVRFIHGRTDFSLAVENTQTLIRAAEQAGVQRFVHLSVTNPNVRSPLAYFRGKAQVEQAIRASSLSYAIVRPTLIFGEGDILVNNIAWLLRRFPVFGIPGDGAYRLQPVYAEDVAAIAVDAGQRRDLVVLDAAGPDTFTFEAMVRLIAAKVRSRALIVHMWTPLALLCAGAIGAAVGDTVLTRQEAEGLMAGLLVSQEPPAGRQRFADWLSTPAATPGRHYASELARHYR